MQDVRIGGVWLERCSNLDFHGPYEQTYTNEELPFTQGRILKLDDTKEPYMATVQVGYTLAPSSDALVFCLACSLCSMLSREPNPGFTTCNWHSSPKCQRCIVMFSYTWDSLRLCSLYCKADMRLDPSPRP